ncbi:MAG TPA: hypothetical protein VGK73_24640 [Polyangiaceae bacterium]
MTSKLFGLAVLFTALLHAACARSRGEAAPAQAPASEARNVEPSSPPADASSEELRKRCAVALDDECVQLAAKVSKTRPDAAVRIFSEACDANVARGCAELGTAYVHGEGLPQDGYRADAAFAKACRLDPLFCD